MADTEMAQNRTAEGWVGPVSEAVLASVSMEM